MTLRRTSHSVYDTSYHLVWCPKYRKKVFEREDVRERAKQMIGEICEAYDIEIQEMELIEDHIHLLVSFSPSRSIGEAVRIIKSLSGRGLFREFPGLKKRFWGGELWEDGYFARTVGDRMTSEVIRKYIVSHRELEHGPAQLALKLRS
ncbi:MAG: IS200/IS605 family transposase [Candidatus Aminicenantes bacterium]|nr:IS200/IS605 family transposase [Candidatus Aminicenantes bacterium]